MKTIKKFVMALILLGGAVAMISCEEEEETTVNSDDCYEELVQLAEMLNERSVTFNNSPTSANCESLRTAALNLLDAAEDCEDYGYMYEEAAQTWLEIDCSVFD